MPFSEGPQLSYTALLFFREKQTEARFSTRSHCSRHACLHASALQLLVAVSARLRVVSASRLFIRTPCETYTVLRSITLT